MVFLLLFVLIPVVELYFMIEVGDSIGAFNTVLLVILTAIIGGFLVRIQGFTTLMRVRQQMDSGQMPALEILEGIILLISGVMLLLPGFVTDTLGFLMLVPPLRKAVVIAFIKKRAASVQSHSTNRVFESEEFYRDEAGQIHRQRNRIIEADDWKSDDSK